MTGLESEIKQLIVKSLKLEDVKPEDIDSGSPLFMDGLGLDSIDALELGIAIKKKFNVSLSADSSENQKHFHSVSSLAEFIRTQSAPGVN